VKYGLRNARGQVPKACSSAKDLTEGERHAAGICGQVEAWQTVRYGNSDLGAGCVEVLLGLEHVRALLHQLRREAHRQLLRQLETGELKLRWEFLARKSARQLHQQVTLLSQLL